jgi:hypothetical protein
MRGCRSHSSKNPVDMLKGLTVSGAVASLALAGLAAGSGHLVPRAQSGEVPPTASNIQSESVQYFQYRAQAWTPQAPSDADIQLRAQKLIDNQHHNDEVLEQYERVERHVDRTGGDTPRVLEDKTYRVVPTGTGTISPTTARMERPARGHAQTRRSENENSL